MPGFEIKRPVAAVAMAMAAMLSLCAEARSPIPGKWCVTNRFGVNLVILALVGCKVSVILYCFRLAGAFSSCHISTLEATDLDLIWVFWILKVGAKFRSFCTVLVI
jgi:hypothetical protein